MKSIKVLEKELVQRDDAIAVWSGTFLHRDETSATVAMKRVCGKRSSMYRLERDDLIHVNVPLKVGDRFIYSLIWRSGHVIHEWQADTDIDRRLRARARKMTRGMGPKSG